MSASRVHRPVDEIAASCRPPDRAKLCSAGADSIPLHCPAFGLGAFLPGVRTRASARRDTLRGGRPLAVEDHHLDREFVGGNLLFNGWAQKASQECLHILPRDLRFLHGSIARTDLLRRSNWAN